MDGAKYTDAQIWEFVGVVMGLARAGRRSTRAVLAQCPPCHFFALERLHRTIRQRGRDGAIYMGDLAAALHDSPQAASRTIRILEKDGLAERRPDPKDRRKTLVCLTPLGLERLAVCEEALKEYLRSVWERLGGEHSAALLREVRLLQEALAAQIPVGAADGEGGQLPAGEPGAPPPADPPRRP